MQTSFGAGGPGRNVTENPILHAISPLSLIALLLFIKLPLVGAPMINPDDYHWGEFLLPWWSLSKFHMIPYFDFCPARGLTNYLPGFFASTFFDGTAASFEAAEPFVAAFCLLLFFPAIAKTIGKFPAFLAFVLMPTANGISEIDMLVTAGLCVLCEAYLRLAPSMWIAAWVAVGTAVTLAAPGQGGLLVLATMPLGIAATFQGLKHDRAKCFIGLGVVLTFLAVLAILTPVGKMLIGAVRYGAEQSSINSVAHGIEWACSWPGKDLPLNTWLWEAVRASWMVVAIVACILLLRCAIDRQYGTGKRAVVFAVPIFLLMVFYVIRAAGRIDPPGVSRLGIASTWALSLLLPVLLISVYGKRHRLSIVVVWTFLAAIICPFFGSVDLHAILLKSSQAIAEPANLSRGIDLGLPNLGTATIDAAQLKRLQSLKHTLGILVDPDETYLDMTNRNANYFYLGYKPPIEVPAVYNLVCDGQQYRAVRALEKQPPPVVLAGANNILHDGGTVAYRSYQLYRFVIKDYIPVAIDEFVYMVRPDRLARAEAIAGTQNQDNEESRMVLLDALFRMGSIERLPISWGRSLKTLKKKMRLVKAFQESSPPSRHSVRIDDNGAFLTEGPDLSISYDIGDLNGSDAGILTFKLNYIGKRHGEPFRISWGSRDSYPANNTVQFVAKNGSVVVPLDTAPRWLLAGDIKSIRIEIADPDSCKSFCITDFKLWQRYTVNEITQ